MRGTTTSPTAPLIPIPGVDYRNGTARDGCPAFDRRPAPPALPGGGGSGGAQPMADAVVAGAGPGVTGAPPAAGGGGGAEDEPRLGLLPVVRRVWAPRGRRPVAHVRR